MSKFLLFLGTTLFCSSLLVAQPLQNALDFDGVDDRAVVNNASAFIANGSGISLSLWVYPTNSAPAFPNFDGFAGFRNETNCDFYLIQIGPSTVEGRFRNANNTAYTITFNTLTLFAWNHIVLTYNGNALTMYKDGIQVANTTASGSISNATVPFYMGNVQFNNVPFLLSGTLDDVGLWNRGLSATEVGCIYSSGIPPTSNGLQLYYKFNQGIENGNNPTETTAIDSKGNSNATLQNFGLSGTTSNWVTGKVCNITEVQTLCPGATINWRGQSVSQLGNYLTSVTSPTGCDSVIELTTVAPANSIDLSISQIGNNQLTVLQTNAQYQWIDCNTNQNIPGATSMNFIATANGMYGCMITYFSCTATTPCITLTAVGTASLTDYNVSIYPNPSVEMAVVQFGQSIQNATIQLLDSFGKIIRTNSPINGTGFNIATNNLSPGVYFVKVETDKGVIVKKLMH